MHELFISYCRHDSDAANALADMLAKAGLSVWLDRQAIQDGDIGLDWQFSGVGNFSGVRGETDLLLRAAAAPAQRRAWASGASQQSERESEREALP
jgi:TIR domain-containing protein